MTQVAVSLQVASIRVTSRVTMTPPDKSSSALHLLVQPYLLYTLQYPASTPVPPSLFTGKHLFLSVTSSPGEITLVIGRDDEAGGTNTTSSAAGDVELWEELGMGRPRESAGPWRAFRVRGPLDLSESDRACAAVQNSHRSCSRALSGPLLADRSLTRAGLTGILNELTTPLRHASVPIYALSTW